MYEVIKKQNGEAFAKTIQKLDERIFLIPDLKWILRYAGRNPLPIFPFLRYKADQLMGKKSSNKDPIKLLNEAGYDAFYVETQDQKKSIKKYFAPNEEMHAVRIDDYLKYYHLIYAVKKGAEQLKRVDFKEPYYDDEYAKSVISIQISKEDNDLFIENRYAGYGPTYHLNPDNIIAGLADSLEKKFHKKLTPMRHLMPKFFLQPDERLIHYNFERNGVYFSEGFYFKNGIVYELDKDYQCLVDVYLFDLKEKKVTNILNEKDRFARILTHEMKGKTVQKKKEKEGFSLYLNGEKFISVNQESSPTYLRLFKAKNLPSHTLNGGADIKEEGWNAFKDGWNELRTFIGDNLRTIGSHSFNVLKKLEVFKADKLKKVGRDSFGCSFKEGTDELNFDALTKLGVDSFNMINAKKMRFKRLKIIPRESFCDLYETEELIFDSALEMRGNAVWNNKCLKKLLAPKVKRMYGGNVRQNDLLQDIDFESLECLSFSDISSNNSLKKGIFKSLKEIDGYNVLSHNHKDIYVEAPALKESDDDLRVKYLYAPLLDTDKMKKQGCLKGVLLLKEPMSELKKRNSAPQVVISSLKSGLVSCFKRMVMGKNNTRG